jgi:hypothetical protein
MGARAFAIVVGLISIGSAFAVLRFPAIAILTLVIFLGIGLMFMGFDRLPAGITGYPYAWAVRLPARLGGPAESGLSSPRPLRGRSPVGRNGIRVSVARPSAGGAGVLSERLLWSVANEIV